MAASGAAVKIPPDWLREPNFPTRSELLEARRLDAHQLALASPSQSLVSSADRRQFARSETIFRDSFRKSGAFDFSSQPTVDAAQFHARATCSGLATRSAVLDARHSKTHSESLKFEPQEVERLRDIPKADALKRWWTQPRDGYVDDPSTFCAASLRLELARHGLGVGPMDPAKVRCPASVDERKQLQTKKAQLAEKVQRVAHAVPDAYLKSERAETATIMRAPDLYAQERRSGGSESEGAGGAGAGGILSRSGASLPPAFPLVSPIKVPLSKRSRRRQHAQSLGIETLFLESTSQRMLLDQLKTCSPPSSSSSNHHVGGGGFNARTRAANASSFTLSASQQQSADEQHEQHSPNQSPGKDGVVRCGGFSR